MSLPLSVIIPTLNCRQALSHSTDGTRELLRDRLEPLGATLLSRPPGLYESWNAAIGCAAAPWTYVSTIGDVISRTGITALLDTAQRLDADLVVSPPRMVLEDGTTPAQARWPVHYLAEALGAGAAPRLLSRLETVIVLCSYATASVLGSSAANVYRTKTLQAHPFPTEFGHAGDTAWGLRHCAHLRLAIDPTPVSNFCLGWEFKETDPRDQRQLFLRLNAEASAALEASAVENPELRLALGWFRALVANKTVLWDWLAAQASLVEEHAELRTYLEHVEAEKARSLRSRIKRLIGR